MGGTKSESVIHCIYSNEIAHKGKGQKTMINQLINVIAGSMLDSWFAHCVTVNGDITCRLNTVQAGAIMFQGATLIVVLLVIALVLFGVGAVRLIRR